MGREWYFQQMVLDHWKSIRKIITWIPLSYNMQNLKWIKDINVGVETIHLLEHIGVNFHDQDQATFSYI